MKPERNMKIKEVIQMGTDFLEVTEYPEWLANIVYIPKKDRKVRMCVNSRDMNKASRKGDFHYRLSTSL